MSFQRGDGVVYVNRSTTYYIDRDNETRSTVTVAKVTSVTRDGMIKKIALPGWAEPIDPHRLADTATADAYRLPKADWDIDAVMDYVANRPWSHKPEHKGMPFDTLEQARAELRQFRTKEIADV